MARPCARPTRPPPTRSTARSSSRPRPRSAGAAPRSAPPASTAAIKWDPLFAAYLAGEPIAPRAATELHGADLAAAVLLLIASAETGAFNASDLLLDRHDLIARVQRLTGCPHPPPPRASGPPPGVMACDRLAALGWRPGGWPRLDAWLASLGLGR